MASRLPKQIVLKSSYGAYVCYLSGERLHGYIGADEKSVFNPLVKIEVEPAKTNPDFIHLRFYHSNKYWALKSADSYEMVAASDQPQEDTSKFSCTLFKPTFDATDGTLFNLIHVHSGRHVGTDRSFIYVDDKDKGDGYYTYALTFVDWSSLVKLPARVALKGDNGKYLRAMWQDGLPYLQFSSGDGNDEGCSYEVHLLDDGHVRLKSYDKFWRLSPNWIWADSSSEFPRDVNTRFWPVRLDGTTIALRNEGNKNFCKRLTADNKTDCLNAAVRTITHEAKMVVEELVMERNVYNVQFRMENARIFDQKPFLAGVGTATNETDRESTLTIRVAYEDTRTYSFSNSFSITAGVKTTIQTGLPRIVEGQIEVSAEVTNVLEWERSTEEKKVAEATYTVNVAAKSRARVNYVGTQGKCSVPFSYTRRDKSSSDGMVVTSQHVDGVYNGVNYYSFRFEQLPTEPLSDHDN